MFAGNYAQSLQLVTSVPFNMQCIWSYKDGFNFHMAMSFGVDQSCFDMLHAKLVDEGLYCEDTCPPPDYC